MRPYNVQVLRSHLRKGAYNHFPSFYFLFIEYVIATLIHLHDLVIRKQILGTILRHAIATLDQKQLLEIHI